MRYLHYGAWGGSLEELKRKNAKATETLRQMQDSQTASG